MQRTKVEVVGSQSWLTMSFELNESLGIKGSSGKEEVGWSSEECSLPCPLAF